MARSEQNKLKNNINETIISNKETKSLSNISKEIKKQNKDKLREKVNEKADQNKKVVLLDSFKILLTQQKYKDALSLYVNQANNDTITKYNKSLFSHIKKEVSNKNFAVKKLINLFLQIEYEHPLTLYYLSKIQYQEQEFETSIMTLLKIKEVYVNDKLSQAILKELTQNVNSYLSLLDKQKDVKNKLTFLLTLLEKDPSNAQYKYVLAKLYFDLKYYEKAKDMFEEISSNELYQNKILAYLNTINKKIKIREKFTQKIFLDKKGTHFFIEAKINDSIKVKLLIDTGASLTLIDNKVFEELDLSKLKTVNLNTANGTVRANITNVDSFSINDLSFSNFEISISSLNTDFDGLLGMNYLMNFDFYIDQDDAILYLNPL